MVVMVVLLVKVEDILLLVNGKRAIVVVCVDVLVVYSGDIIVHADGSRSRRDVDIHIQQILGNQKIRSRWLRPDAGFDNNIVWIVVVQLCVTRIRHLRLI